MTFVLYKVKVWQKLENFEHDDKMSNNAYFSNVNRKKTYKSKNE